MQELTKESKQLYFNESDIQFSMAWAIKRLYTDAKIEMEVPIMSLDSDRSRRTKRVDIVVSLNGNVYAIELKYRRKGIKEYNGREMKGDNRDRTEFSRDLQRLEELVCGKQEIYNKNITAGYAVWFTNDSRIWESKINTNRNEYKDDEFLSVKCGDTLGGHTEPIIVKQYEQSGMTIFIQGSYAITWKDFCKFDCVNGLLKYTIVNVH